MDGREKLQFKCEQCDYVSQRSSNLKRHIRTVHTTQTKRPYKCDICGICSFKEKHHLTDHKASHGLTELEHACSDCDYRTHLKQNLTRHKLSHMPKAQQCTQCDKKFRTKTDLKQHVATMHGGEHHHCDQCDYYSERRARLLEHMRVHTGEKRYKCPVCARAFAFSSNFNTHMKSLHGTG